MTAHLRIPSLTNLAAVDSLPLSPTAAGMGAAAAAAAAGGSPLPMPGAARFPRVASLDQFRCAPQLSSWFRVNGQDSSSRCPGDSKS